MRAEDVGARTWLYAGLAGWAVLVWALAMFGMGGSIDRLADDPSLRQPLPPPGAPAEERLGPFARYADIAARPLFTDNRRPQPFVIDPMGEAESATGGFDYVLTSVLRTPTVELVILQPAAGGDPVRVKLGEAPEAAPGWVLQSVQPRGAVFVGPEGERSLELRVFDGTGGQPPTPMTRSATGTATLPARARAGADPARSAAPPAVAGDAAMSGDGAPTPLPSPQAEAAAQDQVEMIRRRIEERRARLREEQRARTGQPPTENQ